MSEHPDELVELVFMEMPAHPDIAGMYVAARRILDALAAAGRLVPDGSLVEEQHGRRCEHGDFWSATAPEHFVQPRGTHARAIRRTVITTPAKVVE